MRASCRWQLCQTGAAHPPLTQAVLWGGFLGSLALRERGLWPLPRFQGMAPECAQLLQSPGPAFLPQQGLKVKDQLGCFVISLQ